MAICLKVVVIRRRHNRNLEGMVNKWVYDQEDKKRHVKWKKKQLKGV